MTPLELILSAISAATNTNDPTLKALWLAAARTEVDRQRAEIDQADAHVTALEKELARVAREARQVPMFGGNP